MPTAKFNLPRPDAATLARDLPKMLSDQADAIDRVLGDFDYNGRDPNYLVQRVVQLEGKVASLTAKRIERRSLDVSLSGQPANSSGIYYQDLAPITFAQAFPTPPLLQATCVTQWGAVQWYQITEVTRTGFKARVMRLGGAPVATTLNYTAVEA